MYYCALVDCHALHDEQRSLAVGEHVDHSMYVLELCGEPCTYHIVFVKNNNINRPSSSSSESHPHHSSRIKTPKKNYNYDDNNINNNINAATGLADAFL